MHVREYTIIVFDIPDDSPFVCPIKSSVDSNEQIEFIDLSDVRAALPTCVDWATMYHYLKSGQLPENEKEARRLIYESQNFLLEDGL